MLIPLQDSTTLKTFEITDHGYVLHLHHHHDAATQLQSIKDALRMNPNGNLYLINVVLEPEPIMHIMGHTVEKVLGDLQEGEILTPAQGKYIQTIISTQHAKDQEAQKQHEASLAVALSELAVLEAEYTAPPPAVDKAAAGAAAAAREESFEGIEHVAIAHCGLKRFFEQYAAADPDKILQGLFARDTSAAGITWYMSLPGGAKISVPDIAGLASDFFGEPEQPVAHGINDAEKKRRFRLAVATLAYADPSEIKKITTVFEEEWRAIQAAKAKGESPAEALEKLNYAFRKDLKYTRITKGRYLWLSLLNYDHFGEDAKTTYAIGHTLAMELAQEAKRTDNRELLRMAFLYELFASHCLADLFAAGHMRTPRAALAGASSMTSVGLLRTCRAAYQSLKMHAEDNHAGLWVSSIKHPKPRQAFGDGRLFEADNIKTFNQAVLAMSAGLSDVFEAYQNPELPLTFSACDYLPDCQPYAAKNPPPMYDVVGDRIEPRGKSPTPSAPSKDRHRLFSWLFHHHTIVMKKTSVADPSLTDAELDEQAQRLASVSSCSH